MVVVSPNETDEGSAVTDGVVAAAAGDAALTSAASKTARAGSEVLVRTEDPFVGARNASRAPRFTRDGGRRRPRAIWPVVEGLAYADTGPPEGSSAMTRMPTRLPLGAILSAVSAAICAVPTLVLPADSPNAPKTAFLAVGAVFFAVGVARVRSEANPRRVVAPYDDGDGDS